MIAMERDDLMWLAGLLEGEGCFSIHRKSTSDRAYADVRVQMTDEDVVERVAALMGATVTSHAPRGGQRKRTYCTRKTGKGAEQIMILVQPYMGDRRYGKIADIREELVF